DETLPVMQSIAILAVTRHPGLIGHQGITPPGQTVEKCRLADVRPSYQRNDRQDRCIRWHDVQFGAKRTRATSPSALSTIASSPTTTGWERIALLNGRPRPTISPFSGEIQCR